MKNKALKLLVLDHLLERIARIRHFCSKDCSGSYFNEQRNELLGKRDQIIEDRRLLRTYYEEAEQKFKEVVAERH